MGERTFFSRPHATYTKTDHILVSKRNLNKWKVITIIKTLLSNHHGIKNKRTRGKL